jgi:hypothetical protein
MRQRMMGNKKSKRRVLVFCDKGISRSASIIIGFIMVLTDASFDLVWKTLVTMRQRVNPRDEYKSQLRQSSKLISNNISVMKKRSREISNIGKVAEVLSQTPAERDSIKTWIIDHCIQHIKHYCKSFNLQKLMHEEPFTAMNFCEAFDIKSSKYDTWCLPSESLVRDWNECLRKADTVLSEKNKKIARK